MKTDTTSVDLHSYGYLARSFLGQQKKNALFEHSSVSWLMFIASHIHTDDPIETEKSGHELLVKLEESLQKMTLDLRSLEAK